MVSHLYDSVILSPSFHSELVLNGIKEQAPRRISANGLKKAKKKGRFSLTKFILSPSLHSELTLNELKG
ncbi:MAG: hypothetical protein AMJ92_01915 [candidate division Zixibacteria bacterium SM23_81]|nr:MAG: hypothetical protein AMJ92_01915 [candidate division Zixibacteria bacterium SM23_81]